MLRLRFLTAATVTLVLGFGGLTEAQAQAAPAAAGLAADPHLLRWDPSIRYGVLPNGLRYAVQHNAVPKGGLALRLGIGVGSFDEAEDERGAAHMIEHLAFDGTRAFPEHQLDLIFAPLHVAYGRDRTATSDLKATTYQLDLPSSDASALTTATRWLSDVAEGLTFAEPAMAKERAAMEAERRARTADPLRALRIRIDAFEDGDLRSAARLPIGTPESLAALTPAKLTSFYDRWYRPDNAVVVLVGDLPIDVLEQKVKATFGDWQPRGPAGLRAPRTPPSTPRGAEARVLTETSLPAIAGICRVAAPDDVGAAPDQRLHALLLRGLWEAILQQRINTLKSRRDAPFIEATLNDEVRPDSLKTCFGIIPRDGQEVRAVGMIEAEIRRFEAEGPTEEETDAGLEQVRASVRGAIAATSHDSRDQATEILTRALDNLARLTPREGLRAFDVLMEDTGPATVRAAFARDWSGWGPLAPVNSPKPLSEVAIRTAMTSGEYRSTGAK